MIPLKYNVRNLRVRWKTTLMTVLGTGLVVWSSCILFGLVDGLEHSLTISGDPLDLIVMRKGSTNETTGGFESSKADDLLNLPGIARDVDGRPMAAKELLNIPIAERQNGTRTNIIVRGVQAASPKLRPNFRIITGTFPAEGTGECIVSPSLSKRFKGAQVGGILKFGDQEIYRVVGLFTAGGSSAESEVWADLKDVEKNTGRDGSVSCVQIRAASADDYRKLEDTIENDTRFKLAAIPESVYFQNQSRSSIFLKGAGTLIAVLLTFGAMFAAANTMFAAVGARTREIGTMRALGFSQFDILICFMGESLILCALGGIAGVLAAIPLNTLTYETSDFNSFASMTVAFRFGPLVMGVAFLMTLAMGVFGGMFPALRAVRLDVISALREL
ncbi:MAG: ABC transporter permease [Isosphaeraceae bacterium]